MRKYFILLILVFICSCTQQINVKREVSQETPPKEAVKKEVLPSVSPISTPSLVPEIPIQITEEPVVSLNETITPLYGKLLSNVRISKASFNPSQGEELAIYYNLSGPSKVTVDIYDPDHGLIKNIISGKPSNQGEHTTIWDGKDMDGKVVSDEDYFFTIIAKDKNGTEEIYDPTTFSGGVEHDITSADVSTQGQTITYRMPEMGRVMIRMGIQGGPLLNTIVDWKPRTKGMVTEYWNGKDKDNLIDLHNHPKFKMIVTYFTLPANSVISFGNKEQRYREYKRSLVNKRTLKIKRASSISKVSHHYHIPRMEDYSPGVKMEFMNTQGTDDKGNTILKKKTLVKVELDEKDKALFTNQQFEIVFFLDNEFYAEDEAGYTPFNWVWDMANVAEGEHLFTVNLSSFKDQIGVLSQKVMVVK